MPVAGPWGTEAMCGAAALWHDRDERVLFTGHHSERFEWCVECLVIAGNAIREVKKPGHFKFRRRKSR